MALTQTKISETGERGLAFYHEDIKHRLTDADKGRYVAVDCISGEWEIGDTIDSAEKLLSRVPNADVLIVRHIIIASGYWGSGSRELATCK